VGFGALNLFWNWQERRRQRRLASSRIPLNRDEFLVRLTGDNVDIRTAEFLWDELSYYYFNPLRPDPSDRLRSTLRIDPDDVCDLVEKYWKNRVSLKDPVDVVQIPEDPSITELGEFLDRLTQSAA
jgi:hypothetical protein